VNLYASSTQAYTEPGYRTLLEERGFREVVFHLSLTGKLDALQEGMFVILGRK
jgi:hypothetical protein